MKTAIQLLLSYVVAAALTEHVSMTPALTHWGNLWTYFWIVFAIPIVFFSVAATIMVFAGFLAMFTK